MRGELMQRRFHRSDPRVQGLDIGTNHREGCINVVLDQGVSVGHHTVDRLVDSRDVVLVLLDVLGHDIDRIPVLGDCSVGMRDG